MREQKEAVIGFEEKIAWIVDALREKKAEDIKGIDLRKLDGVIVDGFLICSATSERHVASISENVRLRLKEKGEPVRNIEGEMTHQWVLIDAHDIIVHVFLVRVREFYRLDQLWTHGESITIQNDDPNPSHQMV